MNVLLISSDLMIASMLEGPVRAAGVQLRCVAPGAAVEAAAEHAPRLVVVDLGGAVGDVAGLVAGLREAAPRAVVTAFGPHVHGAKLQAARDAGCDRVLTRGEFHRKAAEVIASAAAAG